MHGRLQELSEQPRHVAVICGGAVSGSEAAAACAERGIVAIVLEQNARPYGKIEDGLPRWHDKLRAKEYERIDENLSKPGVLYVPCTKLGVDLSFERVVRGWGASTVLLANGAWRDRPLPVKVPSGVDLVKSGLVYQNPFVYWFNHNEDPGFQTAALQVAGQPIASYQIADGAVVVGGGLASVDVIKIINLELCRAALRRRSIEVSVVEMEHQGIPDTLAKHGLTLDSLGVRGGTLFYRRRVRDMPLAFAKEGATPEQVLKVESIREKMVGILKEKFCVRVQDCSAPIAPILEDGKLVGLTFRRMEHKDGKAVELPGSDFDVRSELIVSSIGSVPEVVEGVPTQGELYDYASWATGAVRGLPGVFGLGNVLTGKGNIKDSRINARAISDTVMSEYLGIAAERSPHLMDSAHDAARKTADSALQSAIRRAKIPTDKLEHIAEALDARWTATGYDGDYGRWIREHKPSS